MTTKDYNGITEFSNYFRKLYEVTGRLQQDCNDDQLIEEIYPIITCLENKPDDMELQKCVDALQRINDKLFGIYMVKESILDFQVLINKLRYYADAPDQKELIQYDDGKFAQ